ncbi:MAG: DUF4132 domain-containing protein [Solobacterium sp.]|nr:DUF4132 domain-containing protein [Solobacterium sp.]
MNESDLKPGERIPFGRYFWEILEVDLTEKTMLVIADKEVTKMGFNTSWEKKNWEDCRQRKWLNKDFLNREFTELEQAAILRTYLENTADRVYLLNAEEALKYYPNYPSRICGDGWWLRFHNALDYRVDYVGRYGEIVRDQMYPSYELGLRPVMRIDLKAEACRSFLSEAYLNSMQKPLFAVRDTTVIGASQWITAAFIPEGITEIADFCFEDSSLLAYVQLPSTLKRIGMAAFRNCWLLDKIEIQSDSVDYGPGCFDGCQNLEYTPQMFLTKGHLDDIFIRHLDVCGSKELAWLFLYQDEEVWGKPLTKKITKGNASDVLDVLTERLSVIKSDVKKPASIAVRYVLANSGKLKAESVQKFINTLQTLGLTEEVKILSEEPAVSQILGLSESADPYRRVLKTGSILEGNITVPLEVGRTITFGQRFWKILEINETDNTMLVISEREVCRKQYHSESHVTWQNCTLRKWLNDKFIREEFTDQEKKAVVRRHPESSGDRIFLLSQEESDKYFKDDNERSTGRPWWLMSISVSGYVQSYVDDKGSYGQSVNHWDEYGVRPIMRLNIDSNACRRFIACDDSGKRMIRSSAMIIDGGSLTAVDPDVEELVLPSYVLSIQKFAFLHCHALKSVTWPGRAPKIDTTAFKDCPKLTLPERFYTGGKLSHDAFAPYMPLTPVLTAFVLLNRKPNDSYYDAVVKRLNAENAPGAADEMLRRLSSGYRMKDVESAVRFILAAAPVLGKERLQKLEKALTDHHTLAPAYRDALVREADMDAPVVPVIGKTLLLRDIVPFEMLRSEWEEPKELPRLAVIMNAVDTYAKQYSEGEILYRYKTRTISEYRIDPEFRKRAEGIDYCTLMSLLKYWGETVDLRWYAPYAALADDMDLEDLINELDRRDKWRNRGKDTLRVRGAVLLNDSRTAMYYAAKLGFLWKYAEMRGMSENVFLDTVYCNFGLDNDLKRSWTFAGKMYTAAVNKDLTVTLYDESGSVVYYMPWQKKADKELRQARAEFKELKKMIKPVVGTMSDRLFEDFLSGTKTPAEDWKESCRRNPLRQMLVKRIVWEQEGKTFILDDSGNAVTADDRPYAVTDSPVTPAHPMEMKQDEVTAWKKYFHVHRLSQPFVQMWEPVIDPKTIRPDRYDGCILKLSMLQNNEKHGIVMKRGELHMPDCRADLSSKTSYSHRGEYEISQFKIRSYSRKVNHIVGLLDLATIEGRIRKDDVQVLTLFDTLTQAQITRYIEIAGKAEAHAVLAELLDYKNKHFETYDPFDEFKLND